MAAVARRRTSRADSDKDQTRTTMKLLYAAKDGQKAEPARFREAAMRKQCKLKRFSFE